MGRFSVLFNSPNSARGGDALGLAQSPLHGEDGCNGVKAHGATGALASPISAKTGLLRRLRAATARSPAQGPSYMQQLAQWGFEAPEGEAEARRQAVKLIWPCLKKRQPYTMLSLDDLGLTTLPPLPPNLKIVGAENNRLTSLGQLPQGLLSIYVANNELTSLPALPLGLEDLNVDNNRLRHLPELPETLRSLQIRNNCLTHLPKFSFRLSSFNGSGNPLISPPGRIAGVGVNDSQAIRYWQIQNPDLVVRGTCA